MTAIPGPARPALRCYYWGEGRPLVNLGDLLVPRLLEAMGFTCLGREAPDAQVVNPGRCLLVIGSLLTARDLDRIGWPVDVWGCGWKGPAAAPDHAEDVRCFAVRGPETATGLGLAPTIALGDPALLLPYLAPRKTRAHGRTIVIPHCSRTTALSASERRARSGCDEVLSPMVLRPPGSSPGPARALPGLVWKWLRQGLKLHDLDGALERLAGAEFALTGSLHGAILAQAFGVPWACYHDGYLDAPGKWTDWASYLGIEIQMVATLAEGLKWWREYGRRGRVRELAPLLDAFPYPLPVVGGTRKGA